MKTWIIFFIITLLICSCSSADPKQDLGVGSDWVYQDLRLLDPIDAPEPIHDLIAVYTRESGRLFQIRLDLLDSDINNKQDLYIILDTNPGGSSQLLVNDELIPMDLQWEYMFILPAVGNVSIIDDNYQQISGTSLLIERNESDNQVLFSFNKSFLPINYNLVKIQVYHIQKGNKNVLDKTTPVSLDSPPPEKIQVGFLFWNSIDTRTPAGTLRSWAGAHSGPGGERHGLSYLLRAAESTNIPLIFLDLQEPDKLAMLDYLNVIPLLEELADQGIIDFQSLENGYLFDLNQESKNNHNNKADYFIREIYKLYNFGNNDYAHLLLTVPACPYLLNSKETSLRTNAFLGECKSLLITNSIHGLTNTILFGGDLSTSYLGNPEHNFDFFSFISSQPWIHIMTKGDFHIRNTSDIYLRETPAEQPNSKIYNEIQNLPGNRISYLSRVIYSKLTHQPTADLNSLGLNYLTSLRYINEAAKWAANPSIYTTCQIDIDLDTNNECVLANKSLFLIVEPQGGYIPFAFASDQGGLHQIIGPTWELMLGMSDQSTWNLNNDLASDPGQILGAVYNEEDIGLYYNPIVFENGVKLMDVNMTMRKRFELNGSSVNIFVDNRNGKQSRDQIPLILDPWTIYTENWGEKYYSRRTTSSLTWGIQSGISIELTSTVPIKTNAFNDSRKYMYAAEDPNFDYTNGHYLPYPLFLTQVETSSDYSIEIKINPSPNH